MIERRKYLQEHEAEERVEKVEHEAVEEVEGHSARGGGQMPRDSR